MTSRCYYAPRPSRARGGAARASPTARGYCFDDDARSQGALWRSHSLRRSCRRRPRHTLPTLRAHRTAEHREDCSSSRTGAEAALQPSTESEGKCVPHRSSERAHGRCRWRSRHHASQSSHQQSLETLCMPCGSSAQCSDGDCVGCASEAALAMPRECGWRGPYAQRRSSRRRRRSPSH